MNLAYRDIRHGFGRFILTCIGLGLLLGVVLAMIGIYRGLVVDALTIARAPAVDLWIVEANTRGRRPHRRRGVGWRHHLSDRRN